MAIRRSTKLINDLAQGYGVRELLRDGRIFVYTGAQPADPDEAPSGTLLMTYTLGGNAFIDAVKAEASIALGGSAVGSLDTVTVGGMAFNLLAESVPFDTSLENTAINVADSINSKQNPLNITAAASGTYVILSMPSWMGAQSDGLTFATTTSGSLTATTSGIFTGGSDAVNGLNFSESISDGTLTKDATTWQAQAIATGTAGWFRFVPCGSTPDGVLDEDIRFDGSVGTNNADMIISTTSIIQDSVHTVSAGTLSELKE